MKKLLTTLSIIFCCLFVAKAQYVNIPDNGLGAALTSYYYPSVYKDLNNKYWIDTTAPAIVNELNLNYFHNDLQGWNIKSLNGIQYFKSLQTLNVSLNPITVIDYLPQGLVELQAAFDSISLIISLPSSLKILNCTDNKILQLPILPPNLTTLIISNNKISQLPLPLSNKLQELNITGNLISSLPLLPDSLQYLYVNQNSNLLCLPKLPDSLKLLVLDTSIIKCLANKPALLKIQDANYLSILIYPICNPTNNPNNCPTFGGYVNIPDSNFAKFLIAKYPTCLYKDASNKYWMDTTCSGVVNDTTLNCSFNNIQSIIGIQYFKSLKHFNCSHNNINSATNLPNALKELNISKNDYPFIVLPNNVEIFDCTSSYFGAGNNKFKLPAMPNSLKVLRCGDNDISLTSVPPNLENLYFENSHIDSLPFLPNSLKILWGVSYIDHCDTTDGGYSSLEYIANIPPNLNQLLLGYSYFLTSIPSIPASLSRLVLFDLSNLTSLPLIPNGVSEINFKRMYNLINYNIPTSVTILSLSQNKLTSIPLSKIANYNGLISLYLCNNKFTTLPSLPDSLKEFYCYYNQLTSLPTLPSKLEFFGGTENNFLSIPNLPDGLKEFNCEYNRNLNCLPTIPQSLTYLGTDSTKIKCISNRPISLSVSLPICNATNNPNNCPIFGTQQPNYVNIPNSLGIGQLKIWQNCCLVCLHSLLGNCWGCWWGCKLLLGKYKMYLAAKKVES